MFMHSYAYVLSFQYTCYILNCVGTFLIVSLSLSLSLLFVLVYVYGTQTQVYSIPEPSSFWGIHFIWSYSFICSVPWWECLKGLLGELFSTRHSFWTPSHLSELRWHWPIRCHSQSELGVTVWRPGHMSFCVDPEVLLQHAWNWFFSTSLSYSRSRYTHCCHTVACC